MAEGAANIIEVFKAIPTGKRISFLITFSIVIGGFIALLMYTNRPDYQVLFSNLDTSDAAKITQKLKENRTPYELKDEGKAILVPSEKVYQLRLDLASEGLPKDNTVGFEIFNNMSFGTTEFVQKLKYQEALQGELERTIMDFDAIAQARVHIVPAGDSLFAEQEKPATAAVVIKMKRGRKLDQRQLQGIINLVSCAVEGLKPKNVSVIDMDGGILTNGYDQNSIGGLSQTQFDYQRKLDKSYEKQIETMLEPVVGPNKVVARVTVDVDFKRVNISEETFDPDSQVIRSEQTQKQSSTDGSQLPSGSPDLLTQGSQLGLNKSASNSKKFEKENSVINYEINKTDKQIVDSPGRIKRLSAAVIIDGPYETKTDANGKKIRVFEPRDRKQMNTFENIVKNAIGFNAARGDQVTVSNISFSMQKNNASDMSMASPPPKINWLDYLRKGTKPILNVVFVILFFIIAIKPFRKWLNQTSEYVSTRALTQGNQRAETPEQASEMQLRQGNKLRLLEATRENPDVAADIIKTWLNEVS